MSDGKVSVINWIGKEEASIALHAFQITLKRLYLIVFTATKFCYIETNCSSPWYVCWNEILLALITVVLISIHLAILNRSFNTFEGRIFKVKCVLANLTNYTSYLSGLTIGKTTLGITSLLVGLQYVIFFTKFTNKFVLQNVIKLAVFDEVTYFCNSLFN